jgi:hypothetical protein
VICGPAIGSNKGDEGVGVDTGHIADLSVFRDGVILADAKTINPEVALRKQRHELYGISYGFRENDVGVRWIKDSRVRDRKRKLKSIRGAGLY